MNLLGVHCSISGGVENAFTEAENLSINTFQIFTRNQRQWKTKPIADDEKDRFENARKKSNYPVLFSHTSYLINLGSADPVIYEKSVEALRTEVERCSRLGLHYCVLHPGAAGEQTLEDAITRIATGLNYVIENTAGNVIILLENTAGQGSSVGGKFENLRLIKEQVNSERTGYCFDTCHAFVAGYDIRTQAGIEDTFSEFDKIVGLKNLKAIHLNDSKGDLNSHLDRHENIGKGKIGLEAFRYVMNNFRELPKVLETPKEDNMDAVNLSVLRELI